MSEFKVGANGVSLTFSVGNLISSWFIPNGNSYISTSEFKWNAPQLLITYRQVEQGKGDLTDEHC